MVVYADVLIVLNFIVDYFLIKLTSLITKSTLKVFRLILASLIGALFSLYIFLPPLNWDFEIFLKFAASAVTVVIGFGFGNIKRFLRCVITLFSVTFGFAGAMIGVWYIFKPTGMVINNSVVYFNISPVFLIAFSVVGYFISFFIRKIFEPKSISAKFCEIEIELDNKKAKTTALIDTGNSLSDPFGNSEIIIADKSVLEEILEEEERKRRYRAVPCTTVSGTELLEGYRSDRVKITGEEKSVILEKPIIALSATRLCGEHKAIINPKCLEESL